MNLTYKQFSTIDLSDPFFDSLKSDYIEFESWFRRKSNEFAYVFYSDIGALDGFLYLKIETGGVDDVLPPLAPATRVKVGTLKINPHGTRLGERFLKKIFDHALAQSVSEIYVTVFAKHTALVDLFKRYGFEQMAVKTTINGNELVLVKHIYSHSTDILKNYPLINSTGSSAYLLSLQPQWHTRLLPDSILNNEDSSIVQDVSHTNSIHKVYLSAMAGMDNLQSGDIILIYRTNDYLGPARFRSVATSVCVIEEYRNICTFKSIDDFMSYCSSYCVFSKEELEQFWKTRKYPHIIRFTYNLALPKRVTRGQMIDDIGLNPNTYWGFLPLTHRQLKAVLTAGELDENHIIN